MFQRNVGFPLAGPSEGERYVSCFLLNGMEGVSCTVSVAPRLLSLMTPSLSLYFSFFLPLEVCSGF